MLIVNGLAFQTPMIAMGLAKIGIVTSRKLWRWWRFAIVGAFIISAIVTPSIDPVTQTLVAGPMIVLYFFGIGLAKLVEGKPIIPRYLGTRTRRSPVAERFPTRRLLPLGRLPYSYKAYSVSLDRGRPAGASMPGQLRGTPPCSQATTRSRF